MFHVESNYEILRDGTGERIPCRFVRAEKLHGDEREFFLFAMSPPLIMIKDVRDESMVARSLLIVTPHPIYYQWKDRLPKNDVPVWLFAYKDELNQTSTYSDLEPIGLANVYCLVETSD